MGILSATAVVPDIRVESRPANPQKGPDSTDRQRVEPKLGNDWQALDADSRAFLADALSADEDPAPDGLIKLLQAAVSADASDLHLSSGVAPHIRVRGELRPLAGTAAISAGEMESILRAHLSPRQQETLSSRGDLDTAISFGGDGPDQLRFRASVFHQSGSLAAAIRLVPSDIPELDDLGLPQVVNRFAELTSGLVLVTGPTGCGKSTTLASMIEQINVSTAAHIVTIEDPIEYRYQCKRSVVQQREVGTDTDSYLSALRAALRQDPDVILIGELRDLDTIRVALTAAETGHVVFATLHSSNATSAITRVIDVFPGDQQNQIRSQLALSIEGSLSQRLLPSNSGRQVPATEVMVASSAVRNLIRSDKIHQLPSVLETGGAEGMHTFDQSLAALVRRRQVDPSVARASAANVANFDRLIQQ